MENAPLKTLSICRESQEVGISCQRDGLQRRVPGPSQFQYWRTSNGCSGSFPTAHRSVWIAFQGFLTAFSRDVHTRRNRNSFHCSLLEVALIAKSHIIFWLSLPIGTFQVQMIFSLIAILTTSRRTMKADYFRVKAMETTSISFEVLETFIIKIMRPVL